MRLIFGLLNKLFGAYPHRLPRIIGKYQLLDTIRVDSPIALGIYILEGKKYFVKYFRGIFPDQNSLNLIQESHVLGGLAQIANGNDLTFSLVAPVTTVIGPGYIALVYPYIEAPTLSLASPTQQKSIIAATLISLGSITAHLSNRLRKQIIKRNWLSHISNVLISGIILTILEPSYIGTIWSSIVEICKCLYQNRKAPLILAHGDLSPDNVLMVQFKPVVIDWESLLLTLPGYEQASTAILSPKVFSPSKIPLPFAYLLRLVALEHAAMELTSRVKRTQYLEVLKQL